MPFTPVAIPSAFSSTSVAQTCSQRSWVAFLVRKEASCSIAASGGSAVVSVIVVDSKGGAEGELILVESRGEMRVKVKATMCLNSIFALAGGRIGGVQNEHRPTPFVTCYKRGETVFILNTVS